MESLEPRVLLSGTNTPEFVSDLPAYFPMGNDALTLGIDGFDADGDALTITATANNAGITPVVVHGSKFARLHFVQSDGSTPMGDILCEIFTDRGGEAAQRFITLATKHINDNGTIAASGTPFYSNVLVHRVIPDFMIQTGDARLGTGYGGSPLGGFMDDFDRDLSFTTRGGVLAMANAGYGTSTSDSQFFITTDISQAQADLLNSKYFIFGQVISGMNIANAIANVPRNSNDRPNNPPILKNIDIIDSSPQDGSVILIPTPGFVGQTQVTISLQDSSGRLTWQTVTLDLQNAKPKVAISDAVVTEGNNGKANAVFTVSLSGAINQPVTVQCATGTWTAYPGSDYVAKTGTVTIPAGQTSATFSVQVNGDAAVEGDEKFAVWVTGATNGIVTDYLAIGTILNDDAPIAVDAYEPNDAIESAADLDVIQGEQSFTNLTIHQVGNQDWFLFKTAAKGSVRLDFTSTQGNVSVTLYDVTGKPTTLRVGGHVVIPCEANQTYYIKAVGVSGAVSSNYSFRIAAPTLGGTPTVTIGEGQAKQVTYIDQDGTRVTVTQKGGQAVLQFVGETVQQLPDDHGGILISDEDGWVDLQEVSLVNTDARSSLTFRTNSGGNGLTEVGRIIGSSLLGKLVAPTLDLAGQGIAMTGFGSILSLQLHDLHSGADIFMPGPATAAGLTITMGQLLDDAQVTLGCYARSITAVQWAGGSLIAPWVKALTIKGGATASGVAGDIGADITLSGLGLAVGKDALGTVKVAGQIAAGTWDVNGGGVSSIQAKSVSANWTLDADGALKKLTATGDLAGTVSALWLGTVRSGAELSAALTARDVDSRGISISSLVAARVGSAAIQGPGGVNSIATTDWQGGSIQAGWLGSLKTTANSRTAALGSFAGDITLTGLGTSARRRAVGSVSIAGDLADSQWRIDDGDVGVVTVKGKVDHAVIRSADSMLGLTLGAVSDSDFLAGLADDVASYPLQRSMDDDDFVNLFATIKTIAIKGIKTMPPEFLVSNSHFSAATIGTVTLRNADFATIGLYVADAGLGQEIKSVSYKNTLTGAAWSWPKQSGPDQDQIIHVMEMT